MFDKMINEVAVKEIKEIAKEIAEKKKNLNSQFESKVRAVDGVYSSKNGKSLEVWKTDKELVADRNWYKDIEFEPRSSKVVEKHILYTDDNAKVFRIDDELVPNNKFEMNGYSYRTDIEGRPATAEGTLRLKDDPSKHPNPDDVIEVIGKGDELKTDDRGHLIGNRFDGSGGMENFTAQDLKLNRGEINQLEKMLAEKVENGDEVYLKIKPKYEGNSRRPTEYKYIYTVNGEKSVQVFRNGGI